MPHFRPKSMVYSKPKLNPATTHGRNALVSSPLVEKWFLVWRTCWWFQGISLFLPRGWKKAVSSSQLAQWSSFPWVPDGYGTVLRSVGLACQGRWLHRAKRERERSSTGTPGKPAGGSTNNDPSTWVWESAGWPHSAACDAQPKKANYHAAHASERPEAWLGFISGEKDHSYKRKHGGQQLHRQMIGYKVDLQKRVGWEGRMEGFEKGVKIWWTFSARRNDKSLQERVWKLTCFSVPLFFCLACFLQIWSKLFQLPSKLSSWANKAKPGERLK